jgi:hypothetical protein
MEKFMPTQEERMAALEQTSVTRTELSNLVRQQARSTVETNERLTMLLGLVTVEQENGKSIKGDIIDLKERVIDNSSEIASLEETLTKRFGSLETRFGSLEANVDKRFGSLEIRFGSLEAKFEQVLQVLTTLAPKTGK